MSVRVEMLPWHPRLGRGVEHDSRSLRYAHPVLPRTALASKRWTRRIAVLDQGQTGSCTGNAGTGWLGTDNTTRQGLLEVGGKPLDETFARDTLYHLATVLDGFPGTWPPDDTGSSGLAIGKALQQLGTATGYTHAFSLAALQTALQDGPALIGIKWLQSMFDTTADGQVKVDRRSSIAGGHEIVVDEVDIERGRLWITNSWSTSWGLSGRAWFSDDDLTWLLADQGDVTVPVPIAAPLPPVPPTPDPGAASFPGATVAVDQHIVHSAARRGMTVTDFQNYHWQHYFNL